MQLEPNTIANIDMFLSSSPNLSSFGTASEPCKLGIFRAAQGSCALLYAHRLLDLPSFQV
jgi:hypothetical protein